MENYEKQVQDFLKKVRNNFTEEILKIRKSLQKDLRKHSKKGLKISRLHVMTLKDKNLLISFDVYTKRNPIVQSNIGNKQTHNFNILTLMFNFDGTVTSQIVSQEDLSKKNHPVENYEKLLLTLKERLTVAMRCNKNRLS